MSLTDSIEIQRNETLVIFVVDKSESMSGTKIQSTRQAILEVIPMLDEIASKDSDDQVKIATLEFSSDFNWMYDEPINNKEFILKDVKAGGICNFGSACFELNSKLSSDAYLQTAYHNFRPIIILFTGSEPTDDYQSGINKLKENSWFKTAIKIAIAIGNDANKDQLKVFTGSMESVIEINNIDALKQILRFTNLEVDDGVESPSYNSFSKTENNETIKKYQQIILKFKISDLKSDEKLEEVQQQLSIKGEEGFKLVNSHIHAASEVRSDSHRFLFFIMEREYIDTIVPGTINQIDDDGDDDDWD